MSIHSNMRKILFAIIAAIALTSCATVPSFQVDNHTSLQEINEICYRDITYVAVFKSVDTVQSPQQTMALKSGCCYDKCVLFIYLAKQSGWNNCELYPVEVKKGNKVYNHMIVETPYGFFDPTDNWQFAKLPAGWTKTTFE